MRKKDLRFFFRLSLLNIRTMLEYKGDFLLMFFSGLFIQTVELVFLFVLFQNIPSVAGWSLYEVSLLFACGFISEGMVTFLFQGTTGFAYYVQTGTFDQFLLRPLSVNIQVLSCKTNPAGAGTALTGFAVMLYAIRHISKVISPISAVIFAINMIIGIIIRVNLNYALAAAIFWLRAPGSFGYLVIKTQEMTRYPLTIYPRWIQAILLSVLPHAVISYVPVCLLLGKLPLIPFVLIPPVSALFMALLRRFILNRALMRYESTGN